MVIQARLWVLNSPSEPSQPRLGDSVVGFEVWATVHLLATCPQKGSGSWKVPSRGQSRVKSVLLSYSGLLLTLLTTTRQAGAYNNTY